MCVRSSPLQGLTVITRNNNNSDKNDNRSTSHNSPITRNNNDHNRRPRKSLITTTTTTPTATRPINLNNQAQQLQQQPQQHQRVVYLLLLGDLHSQNFGGVKDLNGALVFQDVALGRGESVQDLVLCLLQLSVVGCRGDDQLLTLVLQLGSGRCRWILSISDVQSTTKRVSEVSSREASDLHSPELVFGCRVGLALLDERRPLRLALLRVEF